MHGAEGLAQQQAGVAMRRTPGGRLLRGGLPINGIRAVLQEGAVGGADLRQVPPHVSRRLRVPHSLLQHDRHVVPGPA